MKLTTLLIMLSVVSCGGRIDNAPANDTTDAGADAAEPVPQCCILPGPECDARKGTPSECYECSTCGVGAMCQAVCYTGP